MNIELSVSTKGIKTTQHSAEISNSNKGLDNSEKGDLNPKEMMVQHQGTLANEQLIKTIERAIKSLQGPETSLEISVHEKTHDIMVKVLNKETGELIREIPPEKTLDLVAKMMEIAGIIIDEKI